MEAIDKLFARTGGSLESLTREKVVSVLHLRIHLPPRLKHQSKAQLSLWSFERDMLLSFAHQPWMIRGP